jgi:hypothetical protein
MTRAFFRAAGDNARGVSLGRHSALAQEVFAQSAPSRPRRPQER